jgi:hypothetical protein
MPVAVAVSQALIEQSLPAIEQVEPVEQREKHSLLTRLSEHRNTLPDPREPGLVEHKLLAILTIAICAVIGGGADSGVEIEEFSKARQEWLKGFWELRPGMASHDTFGRVFARVSAVAFQTRLCQLDSSGVHADPGASAGDRWQDVAPLL